MNLKKAYIFVCFFSVCYIKFARFDRKKTNSVFVYIITDLAWKHSKKNNSIYVFKVIIAIRALTEPAPQIYSVWSDASPPLAKDKARKTGEADASNSAGTFWFSICIARLTTQADPLQASDVWPKRRGNRDSAILILEVLHKSDEATSNSYA